MNKLNLKVAVAAAMMVMTMGASATGTDPAPEPSSGSGPYGGGNYSNGGFNFTENNNSNADVTSNIAGEATVHGDTTTSSGNIINIADGGSYTTGSAGGGGGGSASSGGKSEVATTAAANAPMIQASNSDMCRHGVSVGMGQVGMGISGGMTLVDKNCEMLKQVRLLNNMGLRDIALAMIAQDSRIANAMRTVDSKRYGKYLNESTETNLEEVSAAAETGANGKEVEHTKPGEMNWNFGG